MELDSFQWAFVAAVAEKNGDEEARRHADGKCEEQVRKELAEERLWQRRLHGKEW